MHKILSLLFLLFFTPFWGFTQISPKEGSKLNYRLIGFAFPAIQQVNNYTIEIATGNYYSTDSFEKKITITLNTKKNKLITEVPSFGKEYTWRTASSTKSGIIYSSLNHFSTLSVPNVDTNIIRLRIIDTAVTNKDAYVFLDATRALYDMAGHPVWYLPDIEGMSSEKYPFRDLKLSPFGSITFLFDERGAYEINYNADILWKAPDKGIVSGDSIEHYHHELTKLNNGHYMVLGYENEFWNGKLPATNDSSFVIIPKKKIKKEENDSIYQTITFGTVIEYDEKGNIVWSWKSSQYFKGSDIYYHKNKKGQPDISPHANSFYFDQKNNFVYVSFRDISRIVKVKYPEGTVDNVYGEIFRPGVKEKGNGLFCSQHSVGISEDGLLYLFNNNLCDSGAFPKVIMMKEPTTKSGSLEKVWEYECKVKGIDPNNRPRQYYFWFGGNSFELPDQSIFISMSSLYSKMLIVSKDKKVLWSAIPEKWNSSSKSWDLVLQYKASIITNEAKLEQLIWNSEK